MLFSSKTLNLGNETFFSHKLLVRFFSYLRSFINLQSPATMNWNTRCSIFVLMSIYRCSNVTLVKSFKIYDENGPSRNNMVNLLTLESPKNVQDKTTISTM